MRSTSSYWDKNAEFVPDPGSYEIRVEMNLESYSANVNVGYNPDQDEYKEYSVIMLDDGNYKFEQQAYGLDELIALWQERSKTDRYVKVVYNYNRERHMQQRSQLDKRVRNEVRFRKAEHRVKRID